MVRIVLISIVCILVFASVMQATNYYVDVTYGFNGNNGLTWGTARKSINAGLGLMSSGDTLHVAAGVYSEPVGMLSGATMLGGYPAGGGPRDASVNITTIQGDGTYEVLSIYNNTNVAVDGFVLTNGTIGVLIFNSTSCVVSNCISRHNTGYKGAGLRVLSSSCQISGCVFEENSVSASDFQDYGAGGYIDNTAGGHVAFDNCIFRNNLMTSNNWSYVNFSGAGLHWSSGTGTMSNCSFVDNEITLLYRQDGGGFDSASGCGLALESLTSITMTDVVISGNTITVDVRDTSFSEQASASVFGGGVSISDCSPSITNAQIFDNAISAYAESTNPVNATANGGGCYISGGGTLTQCTIRENTATAYAVGTGYNSVAQGAGLYKSTSATLIIDRCNIDENQSRNLLGVEPEGWGIESRQGTLQIRNSFITDHGGPGITLYNTNSTITNCTISNSVGYGIYASTSTVDIRNCILWGNNNDLNGCQATYSDIEDMDTGTGNIHCYPDFVGSGDYHLQNYSCCIDKGTSSSAPTVDYDGQTRPLGMYIDIGADEIFAATPTPTPLNTYTPTPTPTSTPTIQPWPDICEDTVPSASDDATVDVNSELIFQELINIAGYSNDYNPGSGGCTGFGAYGPDVVIRVVNNGFNDMLCEFNWDLPDKDGSTYLITNCDYPGSSCVAGSDSGNPEIFTYCISPGQTYYWILDCYNTAEAGLGTATLRYLDPCPAETCAEADTNGLWELDVNFMSGPSYYYVSTVDLTDDYNPGAAFGAAAGPDGVIKVTNSSLNAQYVRFQWEFLSITNTVCYLVSDCTSPLTCLAFNSNSYFTPAQISYCIAPGYEYYFIYDGVHADDVDSGIVTVTLDGTCPGDDCSYPIPLDYNETVLGNTRGLTDYADRDGSGISESIYQACQIGNGDGTDVWYSMLPLPAGNRIYAWISDNPQDVDLYLINHDYNCNTKSCLASAGSVLDYAFTGNEDSISLIVDHNSTSTGGEYLLHVLSDFPISGHIAGDTSCLESKRFPFIAEERYWQSQYCIPADAMYEAGYTSGTYNINKVSWLMCNGFIPDDGRVTVDVWMQNNDTPCPDLCSGMQMNKAYVAYNKVISGNAPGWVGITLDSSFVYEAGKCLIITMCDSVTAGDDHSYNVYFATNLSGGNGRYLVDDTNPLPCDMTGADENCVDYWTTTAFDYVLPPTFTPTPEPTPTPDTTPVNNVCPGSLVFPGTCTCESTFDATNDFDCGAGHEGLDKVFHLVNCIPGKDYLFIATADYDADWAIATVCSASDADLLCADISTPLTDPSCSYFTANQYGYATFQWTAVQTEYWIWIDGWNPGAGGNVCFEIQEILPTPTPTATIPFTSTPTPPIATATPTPLGNVCPGIDIFVGECLCGNTTAYTNNHQCGEGHDGKDIVYNCGGFTPGRTYTLVGEADYDADFTIATMCSGSVGDVYCGDYFDPPSDPSCSSITAVTYGYVTYTWEATQSQYWIWADGWFSEAVGNFCFEILENATPTPEPTPTAVLGTLVGKVTLERPGVTAPDPSWVAPLTVTLCSGSSIVGQYTTTTDQSGNFQVDLPPGIYSIIVKNSHTLGNKIGIIYIYAGTATSLIDFGLLREGDADDDNAVISQDFFILRSAYNTMEGDAGFDAQADFNMDHIVNSSDFFLLRNHYNQSGDVCS